MNRKAPPQKCKQQHASGPLCGLAAPPYQRAKPIYLPSNATDASRGRPPAFFETLARPSTLRASFVCFHSKEHIFCLRFRLQMSWRLFVSVLILKWIGRVCFSFSLKFIGTIFYLPIDQKHMLTAPIGAVCSGLSYGCWVSCVKMHHGLKLDLRAEIIHLVLTGRWYAAEALYCLRNYAKPRDYDKGPFVCFEKHRVWGPFVS